MNYRFCTSPDASLLALLNLGLIRDEGHRNPMGVAELEARMTGWLKGEYQAVLFEKEGTAAGYALFRRDPEFVMLTQFFVIPELRRQGVGRNAIDWLRANVWADAPALRVEVLFGNSAGRAFWRVMGFEDYCVTMEARPSS